MAQRRERNGNGNTSANRRGNGRGMRMAWMVVAAAGLCAAPTALAQFARAVNPDQSVTAEDALVRVRELGEAGNTSEALRVLQLLLENDADRMLAVRDESDPGRFEPVRAACHRVLLEWPELLARYRAAEGENARRRLEEGEHRAVERSHFLTEAGLEAALRVAQEDLEAGRFEAARLRLLACGTHPDAKGPLAQDRARMAIEVAQQLGRQEVRAWAETLAREASVDAEGTWAVREAPARLGMARTGLDAQPPVDLAAIAPKALNSVSPSGDGLAEAILELQDWGQGDAALAEDFAQTLDTSESAMFGASVGGVGGVVLINDGYTVACLDAATLGVRWRTVPPASITPGDDFEIDWAQPMMVGGRLSEPMSWVAAASGVVVAATGVPSEEIRGGTRALHGMDIATGRVLWSISAGRVDPGLIGAEFTGPVLIDGDVAVVSVARSGVMRRESELHMVGVDLFDGRVRWVRRMGSVGVQPWLRQEPRPEAPCLDRGVVYRAADIGILGAYEAATGRPLWVRQLSTARVDELQFRVGMNAGLRAFQVNAPVIDGDSVICHDAIGNKILRVDAASGRLLGSRDASAFGDVRYLLRVGAHLALVGDRHVSFVKASEFEQGLVRMVARFGNAGIVGRCVTSGDALLVPIAGGLVRVDPSNPDGSLGPGANANANADAAQAGDDGEGVDDTGRVAPEIVVARAGNPLVVELGAGVSTLVMAERSLVSTYLRWERAQEILSVRASAEPDDPSPLLTMIELGSRAGRYDEIPRQADRVLALADRDPLASSSVAARSRLFGLLSEMTRKAQRVWEDDGSEGAVPPALLARILGAMGRSAETPEQLVTHAFAEAWLREIRREPAQAIEAYQGVLADPRLADIELEAEDRTDPERLASPVTSIGTAGPEAARRVLNAIKQAGIAAYAGFEDEAQRALESAADNVDALEGVAARYPASLAALRGLARACEIVESSANANERDSRRGLALAARGLELSRVQAGAAREDAWPLVGMFLGRVLDAIEDQRPEAALRLVRAVEADRPDLVVQRRGANADGPSGLGQSVSSIAESLAGRLSARATEGSIAPEFGARLAPMAQPLEGWSLKHALIRSQEFTSRESVLMTSAVEGTLALWTRDATGTTFVPAWTRDARVNRLTPIVVTPEETLLLVQSSLSDDGGSTVAVECVDSATGRVRWRSQALSELMASGDALPRPRANERFGTPLDGQVRGSDIMAVATGQTATDACVWLVGRDGAFASLRVRTGEVVAKGVSGVTHVYDVDAGPSRIAVLGATYRAGASGLQPRVEVLGPTGALLGAVDALGDNADAGPNASPKEANDVNTPLRVNFGDHVRFARVTRTGDVLIGSASGLALVGSVPGNEGGFALRWLREDESLRSLAGAWISPDMRTLVAIDAQSVVLTLDPATGASTPQRPETASRVSIPLDVVPLRGRDGASDALAITSANGLVVIGPDGVVIGADGITPKGNLATPALGATRAACVELFAGSRDLEGDVASRVRIAMVDLPFARVLSTAQVIAPGEVSWVSVLDDTLLITAGDSTVVIDALRE